MGSPANQTKKNLTGLQVKNIFQNSLSLFFGQIEEKHTILTLIVSKAYTMPLVQNPVGSL